MYRKETNIMKTKEHYLILAVITTILSAPALAKQAPSLPEDLPRPLIGRAHPELAGIDKLYVGIAINKQYVGVTPDIDDPQKNGLVWKELETRVMNRLLETGIKVVGNIKTVLTVGLNISELSELRVDIDMLKLNDSQQCIFRIQTSLARTVALQAQPNLHFHADVWKKASQMQTVSIQNMPPTITKVVLEQVDSFIADYRIANPPGKRAADANDIAALITVPTRQTKPPVKPTTAEYKYVASKNSKVFHKADCRWVKRIKPKNLVTYSTRNKAIEAGKRPCKFCKP